MTDHAYRTLEDVAVDPLFPEIDATLRGGRHVEAADPDAYAFLRDAQPFLEPFYRRYGCDLVCSPNGYFYLLPSDSGLIKRRQLSSGAMLVGQALALLYLDPAVAVQRSGRVSRVQVTELVASLVGEERLLQVLNPRVRRRTATVDHERVRQELDRGLKALAALGFVDLEDGEQIRLRSPLLRFADPVRGLEDPRAALERLVAGGEVSLADDAEDEDEP